MGEDYCQITRIPFPYKGNIYRSPMPFSPYDRESRIWSQYLRNEISVIFVLAESKECNTHTRKNLLAFYQSSGLCVFHYPIPDFQVPSDLQSFEDALEVSKNKANQGNNIAVHCLAGLGRTGLFLGCLGKRCYGYDGIEAVAWIRRFIPGSLENTLQEKFVFDF